MTRMTDGERSGLCAALAVCVLLFAPWGTSAANNWIAGILLAVFVLAAFVSHMMAVVGRDSDDMGF
jgi:hypothetical protein